MAKQDDLAALPLFSGVGERHIARLANGAEIRSGLQPGETIYEAGDETTHVFLVRSLPRRDGKARGLVQVELAVPGTGKNVRLARAAELGHFGEIEFLLAGLTTRVRPRRTQARAITQVDLLAIPIAILAEAVAEEPVLRARIVREGAESLVGGLQQGGSYRHGDLAVNLASYLVDCAAEQGIIQGNAAHFPARLTQEAIAVDLGVSRRAVTERLGQWSSRGLLRTSPLEILDFSRVQALARLQDEPPQEVIEDITADIDELIASGDLAAARNRGLDMLHFFPKQPELAFRAALAAARQGAPEDAAIILSASGLALDRTIGALREAVRRGLQTDDGDDEPGALRLSPGAVTTLVEDIGALWARIEKDRAFGAVSPDQARGFAAAAHRAYRTVYEETRRIFPAINAATMAEIAGDRAAARSFAETALKIAKNASDYWSAASSAEALLLLGETEEAKRKLAQASALPDATEGAKASTRLQLTRLAPALGLEPDRLLRNVPVRRPTLISGPLLLPGSRDAAELAAAEEHIRAEVEKALDSGDIGPIYGALACGTDIIVAEAALKRKHDFHVVLPFAAAAFVRASVASGDDRAWLQRFEWCLSKATSLSIAFPGEVRKRDLDGFFHFGTRHAAGRAIRHARALCTEPLMLAVMNRRAPASLAGTARAAADWIAAGREARLIDFPFGRPPVRDAPRGLNAFAAALFVFPEAASGAGQMEQLTQCFRALAPEEAPIVPRPLKDRRAGAVCALADFDAALPLAFQLAADLQAGAIPCRVICDFGPILAAGDKPDVEQLARLDAAADLVGFPSAQPLATGAFAMEALARNVADTDFLPIGRRQRQLHTHKMGEQLEAAHDVFAVVGGGDGGVRYGTRPDV